MNPLSTRQKADLIVGGLAVVLAAVSWVERWWVDAVFFTIFASFFFLIMFAGDVDAAV